MVAVGVEGKGSHRIPGLDPETRKGSYQLPDPYVGFPVVGPMQGSVGVDRDDLLMRVNTDRPLVEG